MLSCLTATLDEQTLFGAADLIDEGARKIEFV
jgi:hypothetical protein